MRLRLWVGMVVAFGLLGTLTVVSGCGSLPANAAAQVNGHVITKDDVAKRIENLRRVYGAMVPDENEGDSFDNFRRETTDQLVREQLENEETGRRNLVVSDDEIQDRFLELADESFLGDVEALKRDYAEKGMSEEEMIADVRRTLLHEKLFYDIGKDIEVTDGDAQAYYERNRSQYDQPERRQVRRIITGSEASAADAVGRIRAGESFLQVVDQVSIDPDAKQKKGALGLVAPGQLPPELDRAALSLAVGQVSDPVKAGEQWYVLTVENIVPPLQKSFEEVKEEIKTLSGNQIFVERYRALVDEIYGAADIRFDPGYDPGHKTESSTQP